MKQRIDTWRKMVESGDKRAQAYLEQITAEAKAEGKIEQMGEAVDFLLGRAAATLDKVECEIKQYTMYERLGKLAEVVNLAYIARNYFGKSRQWLYQRLKGQLVNGKPARFSPAEEAVFLEALNEIGTQLTVISQQK